MSFDVNAALAEGYTKRQIADFLAQEGNFNADAARKEGYSDDHIIGELTGRPYSVTDTKTAIDARPEIPELWQMVGQGVGAAYGVGEAGLRGVGGNIVRRVARELQSELKHPEKMGLSPAEPATAPKPTGGLPTPAVAQPAEYHTPHGLGTGAMKNIEHNIGQKIGNPLHAQLLENDPMLRGYSLRGNSLILTPSGANLGTPPPVAEQPVTMPPAERLTAKQRAAAMLTGPAAKSTAAGAHLVGRVAGPAYGVGQSGLGTAQAINRLQEGTTPREKAAAIANIGAAGTGLGSMAFNPRIKYPAAALSGSLNWLADLIAGEKEAKGHAAGGLARMAKGKSVVEAAKKFIFPKDEMAGLTQIPGTIPTYVKADEILNKMGARGLGLDYGAGLGEGAKVMSGQVHTYEPFHRGKWSPDFTKPEDIPSDAYNRLVNLNVLNVLNPETRAEAVKNIGRVMEPGGTGIVTTRGMDVLRTKSGVPGPEPTSFVTGKGTYQKGFTPAELEEYLKYMLGEGYDISRLGLGPAGAMIKKKADGGLAHMAGGGHATPAWQRKEGQNPEGGLNAKGRASYHAETGGTLKRPQPEGGARRDSFCARMKGAKKKLTSAETARDPGSRINKALRKWNC